MPEIMIQRWPACFQVARTDGWPDAAELGRASTRLPTGLGRHYGSSSGAESARLPTGVMMPDSSQQMPESTTDAWAYWFDLSSEHSAIADELDGIVADGSIAAYPELARTIGVPQDPEWHPEGDVWTHLRLSAQAAADAAPREHRAVSVLAALVHDLGKPATTRIEGGRVRALGHETAGIEPARSFLERIGAPTPIVRRILPLVREHMVHASVTGPPSTRAVHRLVSRLRADGGEATIDDWARLVRADHAGRGVPPSTDPAAAWIDVAQRAGLR